ncbi:MAG TPA: AMP-binding protein [Casimicrobiaceae bacterium]|nr:AMP-binding protein [Casimicrobiaceae bacterium]
MPAEWNFADVWETVADTLPDAIAQSHGNRRFDYRTFDRRADGIANRLLKAGLERHSKVALYLYNTPEFLETAFAVMKAALVPVNTNYRYRQDELHYLWDNADAAAVVFDGAFVDNVRALRERCPKVRLWLHAGRDRSACPQWAASYEEAADRAPGRTRAPWGRSGDDPIFIYTGGTTGRPKGVIWRQHDLYLASNTTSDPVAADADHVRDRLRAATSRPVGLPAAPLMHGTGFVFAATILNRGGTVVTLPDQRFDAERLLAAIEESRVTDASIVGDAFCRPIVDVLDASPKRFDLSSLKVVSSSGMMWSREVKERLLANAPQILMIDFLNSSEASGMGRSITSSRTAAKGARFELGRNAFVIDDDGNPIAPGSGHVGRIAVRGIVPLGYYKDPEKTAATFPIVDGVRCAVPGDYATVEADGAITLLGRGSVSINTGGEKVFPEEVEETIKSLAGVVDAIVVGIADQRLGQAVAALVAAAEPAKLAADAVRSHVKAQLAGYKVPRHVMIVDSVERTVTGKADYNAVRTRVSEWLAKESAKTNTASSHG